MKFIDLTNRPFGRLKVLGRDSAKGARVKWMCQCECGAFRSVAGSNLTTGLTRSCGRHKKKDNDRPKLVKHGLAALTKNRHRSNCMTQKQHDLIQSIINIVENGRRRLTGGYDRRYGSTIKLSRAQCDELVEELECELRWNKVDTAV